MTGNYSYTYHTSAIVIENVLYVHIVLCDCLSGSSSKSAVNMGT